MENATKALMMAASVLIGMILLSIMVYMFMSFGMSSVEIHKQNEQNQLNQFNSQFTSYEGKTGITIYDVITVANLATENNKYYGFEQQIINVTSEDRYSNYITVSLRTHTEDGIGIENHVLENRPDKEYKDLINKDIGLIEHNPEKTLQEYKCEVTISPYTKRVVRADFEIK